jgi:PEP-CTERM motif
MKRFAIVSLLSLSAFGAYAQGTLAFWDNYSDLVFQVYAPSTASPTVPLQGDTSAQLAITGAGNVNNATPVVYTGIAIGGATDPSPSTSLTPGTINYTYGNDFTAEIYALSAGSSPGALPAFSSLLPVSQYTENFTTAGGTANAYLNQVNPANDPGIPGTGYDNSGLKSANGIHILNNAYVAVAAWYNAGGTITSLSQAQADLVPTGKSAVVLVSGLGEPSSVENAGLGGSHTPSTPTEPYYLESFSLTTAPEPGTIALGVMGVCGFLARRRKK